VGTVDWSQIGEGSETPVVGHRPAVEQRGSERMLVYAANNHMAGGIDG
jgi:hypothetical protein